MATPEWNELEPEMKYVFEQTLQDLGMDRSDFSREEYESAQENFARGFGHSHEEYGEFNLSPGAVSEARQAFYDDLYIDEGDFDWEEWREAYDEIFG